MIGYFRVASVALLTMAFAHRTAFAQRTVVGTVTAPDGAPLVEATLAIRGYRLVTKTGSDGRYRIVIPDSIARGVTAALEVHAIGRAMQSAPVLLEGPVIVRDFVMSIDTIRHDFSIGFQNELTYSDSTAFTIFGKVTDSAGAGLPSVSVSLPVTGRGSQSDLQGLYRITVPRAKVSGQVATIRLGVPGYLFVSDTVTLVGVAVHRDFTMWKPIHSGSAVPLDEKIVHAAGLTDLRNGRHRRGEREIRIRIDGGVAIPYELYIFRERGGDASGEYIRYYHARNAEERIPDSNIDNHYFRRTCKKVVFGENFTCRVRLTSEPNWRSLWETLDSLDVWSIADEGPLRKRWSMVLDGSYITAELWDGGTYRAWSYAPGVEDDDPGRTKVSRISELLERIDSLVPP